MDVRAFFVKSHTCQPVLNARQAIFKLRHAVSLSQKDTKSTERHFPNLGFVFCLVCESLDALVVEYIPNLTVLSVQFYRQQRQLQQAFTTLSTDIEISWCLGCNARHARLKGSRIQQSKSKSQTVLH